MVTEQITPTGWIGTLPEYLIYLELVKLKVEFTYQSSKMGGRQERGGAVLDFWMPDYNLAINVASLYWHYGRQDQLLNDKLQREQLEAQGILVIYIDESDALENARYYTEQALEGNDHSRMSKE